MNVRIRFVLADADDVGRTRAIRRLSGRRTKKPVHLRELERTPKLALSVVRIAWFWNETPMRPRAVLAAMGRARILRPADERVASERLVAVAALRERGQCDAGLCP